MTRPQRVGELQLCQDVSAADWLVHGVRGFDHADTVGSLIPTGADAYARLFHPAYRQVDDVLEGVRWRDVARSNGKVAHPAMEWVAITGGWRFLQKETQPGVWDHWPRTGSLPAAEASVLAELLAEHTTTRTACYFAVWEGFGALAVDSDSAPKFAMPDRRMLLFSGPLPAITTSLERRPWDRSASMWWPDDRSWCVATDVDLMSTYIGGTRMCIESLIADERLEAMPVPSDQGFRWDGDGINATPPRAST